MSVIRLGAARIAAVSQGHGLGLTQGPFVGVAISDNRASTIRTLGKFFGHVSVTAARSNNRPQTAPFFDFRHHSICVFLFSHLAPPFGSCALTIQYPSRLSRRVH